MMVWYHPVYTMNLNGRLLHCRIILHFINWSMIWQGNETVSFVFHQVVYKFICWSLPKETNQQSSRVDVLVCYCLLKYSEYISISRVFPWSATWWMCLVRKIGSSLWDLTLCKECINENYHTLYKLRMFYVIKKIVMSVPSAAQVFRCFSLAFLFDPFCFCGLSCLVFRFSQFSSVFFLVFVSCYFF